MKPETIETVIRHLKGIVAALEKEKDHSKDGSFTFKCNGTIPRDEVYIYQGKELKGKIVNIDGTIYLTK